MAQAARQLEAKISEVEANIRAIRGVIEGQHESVNQQIWRVRRAFEQENAELIKECIQKYQELQM